MLNGSVLDSNAALVIPTLVLIPRLTQQLNLFLASFVMPFQVRKATFGNKPSTIVSVDSSQSQIHVTAFRDK